MAPKTVEKEILELERRYWQAIKEKDTAAAIGLTDNPCIVTGSQGVARVDRQTLERMLLAAPWTLHNFELGDDAQVRLLGDLEASDSSTWVRRTGKWLCALHTETIAGDPFGRDRQPVG